MNNKKTKKGGVGIIAVAVIAAIAAGAYFFGGNISSAPEEALKNTAGKAAEIAADKSKEMMEEHGAEVMDKSKEMIADGQKQVMDKSKEMAGEAVDQAIEEGKDAMGNAIKEAGEKMMGSEILPGVFKEYTEADVASYGGAVLDFYAPWCPSCRALEKNIIAHEADIPAGLAILKVDFDTATDLRAKYGVTQQHTFVQVDGEGTLIQKWSGSPTLNAVLSKVK